MATSRLLLAELGIDAFKLKGKRNRSELDDNDPVAESLSPAATDPTNRSHGGTTFSPEHARSIADPESQAGAKETPRSERWQIEIRNYRTIAALTLSETETDAATSRRFSQLADDIALSVNGLATDPLVQTQLIEFNSEWPDASTVEQSWITQLPNLILILAGGSAAVRAYVEQLLRPEALSKRSVIACEDLVSGSQAGPNKAALWRQIRAYDQQ